MKQFKVTYTLNGVQKQDRTAEPAAFTRNLHRQALTDGDSIEHLTFRKEGCAV